MKKLRGLCLSLVALLVVPTPMWAACGAPEVCADAEASFLGTILLDGIRLDWSTDSENSTVAKYVVLRRDCGTPTQCTEKLAEIEPVGTCDVSEDYSYTDADGDDTYVYILEVWNSLNLRECVHETVPE